MQEITINKICLLGMGLLWVLALFGCSAERTFYTYAAKNPDKVAKLCSNVYQADTVYKQGETVTNTDTVTIKGDSIPCPDKPAGVRTVYVKCPDQKVVTKTVTRIDTVYRDRISTLAALDTAKRAVNTARDKQIKAETTSSFYKRWAYILTGLVLAYLIGRFVFKLKI